jgi:pyruvate dehydrogenase E2 component (dihydrolipoamide acetyltransferase)
MPINITMPALSPTMEEGNLAKWLKKEGDAIKAGDVIAEIETDKATMEVEAVDEGTLAKILVNAGTEGVKVNTVIAVLAAEGEDVAAAAKAGGGAKPAPAKANGEATKAASPQGTASAGAAPALRQAQGEGGAGAAPAAAPIAGNRIFSSPLARRLAKEAGLDLAAINGSGPRGRVVQRDVEAAVSSGTGKARAPEIAKAPAAPAPMSDDKVLKLFEEGSYELKPHDNMRKTIARRLIEAKSTIPHFYLTIDCDLDALLALRQQLNDAAPTRKTDKGEEPAYKLSVNDMVIKAMALALQAVPEANASWTEANMVMHRYSDVGVAVSIPGGLITPIIRKAEQKSLSAISNEMKDLARRARERKLKPEEYQGGSTAVSNLGMFGIKDFSAVINPPHATILAVGAGEPRAVVRNGAVKIATVMSVTLSTDHRAVDGALGAQLLSAFKGYIEKPMGMLA